MCAKCMFAVFPIDHINDKQSSTSKTLFWVLNLQIHSTNSGLEIYLVQTIFNDKRSATTPDFPPATVICL